MSASGFSDYPQPELPNFSGYPPPCAGGNLSFRGFLQIQSAISWMCLSNVISMFPMSLQVSIEYLYLPLVNWAFGQENKNNWNILGVKVHVSHFLILKYQGGGYVQEGIFHSGVFYNLQFHECVYQMLYLCFLCLCRLVSSTCTCISPL